MFDRLRRFLHRHSWEVTAWNVYGVPAERACRCGACEHVDLLADLLQKPFGAPSVWLPGPHYIAAEMRVAQPEAHSHA